MTKPAIKNQKFNYYMKGIVKFPVEYLFTKVENKILMNKGCFPKFTPVFILGAPRSGTTLLLQLITRRFKMCFFSNFMDRFYTSPIVAGKIASLFNGCDPIDSFSSFYGRTNSWKDPYDGAKIWSRWFPYDPIYIPEGSLTKNDIKEIQNTISYLEFFFNCPFINKAQRNNGRILEINRIFPNSIFIYVKRSQTEMIQSIYNGFKMLNKKNLWFSMKPSNWKQINTNDLLEHICEEVFYTEVDINRDLKKIGASRLYITDYSKICDQPYTVLDDYNNFFSKINNGQRLITRHEVPKQFTKSQSSHCGEDELKKIEKKLNQLQQ